jgi:hypothetical protein
VHVGRIAPGAQVLKLRAWFAAQFAGSEGGHGEDRR